jgi:hypothetical protein
LSFMLIFSHINITFFCLLLISFPSPTLFTVS